MQNTSIETFNKKLIRLPRVIEITGRPKSYIYNCIKDGTFPAPLKLSPRVACWVEHEIFAWIEKQIATAPRTSSPQSWGKPVATSWVRTSKAGAA